MTLSLRWKQETVTRSFATKIIKELNIKNRKLSEPHIYTLGQDIKRKLFVLNPQPIIIHENKQRASIRLLDGQHRLIAVSREAPEGGVPMMFCYVQGNEIEIQSMQATIDSGKPRNTSDRGGFYALGLPQGYVEKAARLYTVVGADARDRALGVYDWMTAPKASYPCCKEFATDTYNELHTAYEAADRHSKLFFKHTKIKKEYLALSYLMAIMNNASTDDLDAFAKEAANSRSVLACKIQEVWSPGHPFSEKCKEGSKNTSGIQTLLAKDLLLHFLNNTLTSDFQPTLECKTVDGTMFTDFTMN